MFYSHPFRTMQAPGEYAAWAFSDQADAVVRFGEPIVEDDRAAVDWWAVITSSTGAVETLAGISLLRFDDTGCVSEQRDAWAAVTGRADAPMWAR